MEKKPRKKFLPEAPRDDFRKKGTSRFGKSKPAGKYGSKSFRPDEERGDLFEEPLSKKKSRGYGGSDNQRPREQPKPLYSTGKGKRFSRDEEARPFKGKKDFNPGFSRREERQGGFGGGRRDERKSNYRGGNDWQQSKKPYGSGRFRDDDFNTDSPRERRTFNEREDSRSRPKPFLRSDKKKSFFKEEGNERPFKAKKDVDAPFSRGRDDARAFSKDRFSKQREKFGYGERGDRPFKGKRDFNEGFKPKKSFGKKNFKGKAKKEESAPSLTEPFRLNKYLAHAGIASRREADELIKSGFVTVNGQVVLEMGHKVQPGDEVRFKNRVISPEKKVYILLNKPKDYITTASDERGRATVMDLVQNATELRIYPVGRLDRNTTGLLLLTNDGELAQKLTHPSFEAKKVYLASLDKPLKKEDMKQIADGVELEEGKAMVDAVEYADPRDKRKIGIEIHIGWNKVVRRIFEQLGYEVVQLDRVYYAGLTKDVPRGKWRPLTEKEVIMLKHFTN